MKAAVGITTLPNNTFRNIPNVVSQMISLPAGEEWNKSPSIYIRLFGISRIQFREMASKGLIPGVTKASW